MQPPIRKLALTVHLVSSLGWIGAVVAYIALGLGAVNASDAQTIRAAWIGMELIGWYVIVPLAVAALLSGVVISLGTPWGLFRHYWVLISLALTAICVVVLIAHMPSVSATTAALRAGDDLSAPDVTHSTAAGRHAGLDPASGDLFHPTIGLAILLATTALNVFKPRGLTPYGWRKQQEDRARTAAAAPEAIPAHLLK